MKTRSRRSFLKVSALLAVLPISTTLNALAKDRLQAFRDTYSSLSTISLAFSSNAANGSLLAQRGGGYRVEVGDKSFVCDGKQIWTVSKKTKTIVIDSFDPDNEQMSIERVFFVLLNVYQPRLISESGSSSTIQLTPPDASAIIAGVEKVECGVDSKMRIKTIRIFDGGTPTTWTITDLKINKKIDTSNFRVSAKEGWNIIDLR